MKKILFIILILIGENGNAQNTWVQKANFAGIGRASAIGFSIGTKGYIGTGMDIGNIVLSDFWEYDLLTNSWTQKADFGGGVRVSAVGFAIGNKGYAGTGMNSSFQSFNDFWEYDPASNIWSQKTNFAGTKRTMAFGFSISAKGYIGTGRDTTPVNPTDFWEYDQATDSWMQKAGFPGGFRTLAVSFSIGNKGYVGTGDDDNTPVCKKDFWEYDPLNNSWIQKASFGGEVRHMAVGFSIGNLGYIGLGEDIGATGNVTTDFWEYNPATNVWKKRTSPIAPGLNWTMGVSFTGLDKGYVGTGNYITYTDELWEYTPDTINAGCSANFTLYPDTTPHTWIAINNATGSSPLTYSWSWGDGNFSSGPAPSHTYSNPGYYAICLTITDVTGCTDTYCDSSQYLSKGTTNSTMVTVTVINSTTSMNETSVQNNLLTINPNPATDKINISFPATASEKVEIRIYAVTGEKVFEEKIKSKSPISNFQFPVSNFQNGIYFLSVQTGREVVTKKIVVNH